MSVVILGGNECMVREYKDLCREYQCKAKVYPKMSGAMKKLGYQREEIFALLKEKEEEKENAAKA